MAANTSNFQALMKKYLSQMRPFEDIDYFQQLGGEEWILKAADTSKSQGIDTNTMAERLSKFGANRREAPEIACMTTSNISLVEPVLLNFG